MLIYPPLSPKERYARDIGDTGGHLPPLGLATLAAFLQENNVVVELIDALASGLNDNDIIDIVTKEKPKIIGVSALTPIFHRAVMLIKKIKSHFPNILFIVGGHHATIDWKNILPMKIFDIVVIGEGEITTLELISLYRRFEFSKHKLLLDNECLREIKGIAFNFNNEVILTNPRLLIDDIDILPYPARDLLPMEKYLPLPNQYKHLPIVHMVVIRGCPFSCKFCSNNAVFGRKIRARSPIKVVQEIEHLKNEYGAKDISFWDDMMTANKSWMNEFCDLLIQRKVNVTWTCYSRVDTVSKELLQKMYDAGCWNIFFGYESGDQELLNIIGKGITLEQIERANKYCKDIGIEIRASFMLALPGETPEKALKTIKFAKKLNPEYAQFCITTPYPGTELFIMAEKFGKLDKNYSKYNIWEPVFVPYGYKGEEEIKKMEKFAVRSFYLRPRCIYNHLTRIKTWEDFQRYLKGVRFLIGFS